MKLILTNQNGSTQIGPILTGDIDFNYNSFDLMNQNFSRERRYLNLFLFAPEKMQEILKPGKNDYEIVVRVINRCANKDVVPESAIRAVSKLTRRELEILENLSMGLSQEQLAEKLCITIHTVKSHFGSIYDTLGVHNNLCALLAYLIFMSQN